MLSDTHCGSPVTLPVPKAAEPCGALFASRQSPPTCLQLILRIPFAWTVFGPSKVSTNWTRFGDPSPGALTVTRNGPETLAAINFSLSEIACGSRSDYAEGTDL